MFHIDHDHFIVNLPFTSIICNNELENCFNYNLVIDRFKNILFLWGLNWSGNQRILLEPFDDWLSACITVRKAYRMRCGWHERSYGLCIVVSGATPTFLPRCWTIITKWFSKFSNDAAIKEHQSKSDVIKRRLRKKPRKKSLMWGTTENAFVLHWIEKAKEDIELAQKKIEREKRERQENYEFVTKWRSMTKW